MDMEVDIQHTVWISPIVQVEEPTKLWLKACLLDLTASRQSTTRK